MASKAFPMTAFPLLARTDITEAAKRKLAVRVAGISVDLPRLDAWRTMTEDPQSFWHATWNEAAPPGEPEPG
jgi:aminobenzoyl-glutamate utilization protein B